MTENSSKTRILLIQPHGFDITKVVPLSLAYLDAHLDKDNFQVKILDCSLRNILSESEQFATELKEFEPHVVGVTMWSVVYPEGLSALRKSKSILNEVITVVGGIHASMNYKEVMKNRDIDLLLRGEAEFTFPLLMEKIRNSENYNDVSSLVYKDKHNKIIINDEHTLIENLDDIKIPNYESINLSEYHRKGYALKTKADINAPVWFTRGCPYKCQYCSSPMLSGRKIRKHSAEYVTRWINHLYDQGIRHINIIDDNFTFDLKYAKSICRHIIKLNYGDLSVGTPNGVRMQRGDSELWSLMKEAGWKSVNIAPESGSENTLKRMKKGLDPKIIPGIVKDIKMAGLYVHAFFIIGYPGETKQDLIDTRNIILKSDMDSFSLFNFQALPGTPVFHTLIEIGEITESYVPTEKWYQHKNDYRTPGLKDVNLNMFRIMTILLVYLRKPHKLVSVLRNYKLSFILDELSKRIFVNLFEKNILLKKT